ncbi:MAG: sec-independent protein translocase protein TatC [Solirubrobacteraceae bacterium]|jgi:sec-independent protein translocase protein TatC|nr:sec-independent protein translocase protein TatC [Solirubrobacteraceae bacterium]
MVSAIRTISHEDRLSLVEHLDELRTRLMLSAAALAVAFGFCLWQNHALLKIINHPLKSQTQKQVAKGQGTVGQAVVAQQALLKVAGDAQSALGALTQPGSGLSGSARAGLAPLISSLKRDVAKIPRNPPGDNPVTLGVGEPFTTTITVTFYFALIISLPVILLELYGFILPGLAPRERRIALPLLTSVPFLFVGGVLFGYFLVLPAAVRFFVNFNSSEFNVLVQASQFYGFAATVLLAMGLVFQVPVLIIGATRLGLVTPRQLRRHRRYAIVACSVVAAFLPGDIVTLALETVPLYLLYEVSILVASFVGRSDAGLRDEGSASVAGTPSPADDPAPGPDQPVEPTVQEIIDHVDPKLSE